jgi:hypothetical protein
MTLWCCGTSVSLGREGYTRQLAALLPADMSIRNISVGDQTSICGLIRILQHVNEFLPGDVLVWEYPLLDILLEDIYGHDDIVHAMQVAWSKLQTLGVHVIVLKVIPRGDYHLPRPIELEIDVAISHHGATVIDTRQIAGKLKITSPEDEYADDRHPRPDSVLLPAIAAEIFSLIQHMHGQIPRRPDVPFETKWHWFEAGTLEAEATAPAERQNSHVSIKSVVLAPGVSRLRFRKLSRIVAIGTICTHDAGSLWCGHKACAPASLRLTEDIGLPFLLRTSRLPCVRAGIASLVAAPDYALRRDAWADYGHKPTRDANSVELFGILGDVSVPPVVFA